MQEGGAWEGNVFLVVGVIVDHFAIVYFFYFEFGRPSTHYQCQVYNNIVTTIMTR